MNRRQKIIVSVVGIFIVLLALVGITYGYFLTRIQGNTNTTSITVTTADLKLVYEDGNGDISPSETIVPNTTIDEKNFTVTNSGNATVSNFNIYLENVVNELNRKEDLIYTITCEDTTTAQACDSDFVITNTNLTEEDELIFPSVNVTIAKDTLAVNESHTYRIVLKYKEAGVDQSEDMDKRINAKVNIYDTNGLTKLTLGNYILSNGVLVQEVKEETQLIPECVKALGEEECANQNAYETVTTLMDPVYDNTITEITSFTGVSDGTNIEDSGLFVADDDYGKSYYYRGNVKNNYVSFAGFTWKIVRINGDGSVRLILDGTLDTVKKDGENNFAGTTSGFQIDNYDDHAYVGYMFGLAKAIDYSNWCLILENGLVVNKASESGYTTKTECENNGGKWRYTPYNATYSNIGSSTIKTNIDSFYEKYITSEYTKSDGVKVTNAKNMDSNGIGFENYLSDTLFCGDKQGGDGIVLGDNNGYYAAYQRLELPDVASPTLKCVEETPGQVLDSDLNTYSRYTVNAYETTVTKVMTNGDLTYPIALLSADELVMAGAYENEDNLSYYLRISRSEESWWSMTPKSSNYSAAFVYCNHCNNVGFQGQGVPAISIGVRPVININDKVMVEKGDGTSDAPYILKLAS